MQEKSLSVVLWCTSRSYNMQYFKYLKLYLCVILEIYKSILYKWLRILTCSINANKKVNHIIFQRKVVLFEWWNFYWLNGKYFVWSSCGSSNFFSLTIDINWNAKIYCDCLCELSQYMLKINVVHNNKKIYIYTALAVGGSATLAEGLWVRTYTCGHPSILLPDTYESHRSWM